MKPTQQHVKLLQDLQMRYPFTRKLDYYYLGINGKPEAIEQKAFIACLMNEFPHELGCQTLTRTVKGYIIEEDIYSALIVATADFYSKSASRQMEQYRHMGYQQGTPDILILTRSQDFSGLAIEMKSLTGTASKAQKLTLSFLRKQGFSCHVCKGFPAALEAWLTYLGAIS